MGVHDGTVQRALVPIENSLEGSVNATLDALAMETQDVRILGEVVHPIVQCLIARTQLDLSEIEVVVSHPQASAQCARFIRTRLPAARVLVGSSTRRRCGRSRPRMGRGRRSATAWRPSATAARCCGRESRTWPTTRPGSCGSGPRGRRPGSPGGSNAPLGPWKTAIVFWGVGSEAPGWLVSCLSEFAGRGVNLTRIESRPRKQGLGRYMFFTDLEGRDTEPHVADALEGVRAHVEAASGPRLLSGSLIAGRGG